MKNYQKLDWNDPLPECIPGFLETHRPDCNYGRRKWQEMLDTINHCLKLSFPELCFREVKSRTNALWATQTPQNWPSPMLYI